MRHERITPPASPPLVDPLTAPELFVTGVSGVGMVHGTVLVTLEAARFDHTGPQPALERIVSGRLTMTLPAAQALVAGLNTYLSQQGHSPAAAFGQGATRQ